MKRLVRICLLQFVFGLILADASLAQTVLVKRVAISPRLKTGPANTNQISSGLRVFGKGMPIFLTADTTGSGASVVTSFTWSFLLRPTGSNAALDNASAQSVKFTADSTGRYIVQVAVNGGPTSSDTLYAATFIGSTNTASPNLGCGLCHSSNFASWSTTGHAVWFKYGLTGQIEVNQYTGKGLYGNSCVKCHTTGWDPTVNNGNFGYLANQAGWDTTWYKPYAFASGMYQIPYKDSTALKQLTSSYPQLQPLAAIGCESCHGPGKDHNGDKTKIGRSLDAGVCMQCHDAPPYHTKGVEWMASGHATMPLAGSHATFTSCFPCHSGSAFVKWVDNNKNNATTAWSTAADGSYPMTCAVCHDPHSASNPNQLRTMIVDTLRNGYAVPAGLGGKGQLCMNCHRSRYAVSARITTKAPYYGFVDHYGPHGNPQADMLLGQNGYQYGDTTFTGLNTHAGVPDACVTCHMPGGKHTLAMMDTTGGLHDVVTGCTSCHVGIKSFDDIRATYDYDRNGKIESVQTEVQGMLNLLKARLQPAWDPLTGEPTTAIKDSLLVKGHPEYVQGIYTYYFVKNDGSMGVHNAKYAITLLQKALGFYPTEVRSTGKVVPTEYVLNQNYPNPFNPSTTISFSVPQQERVTLEVYDILGKRVVSLMDNAVSAGTFQVTWRGTNQNGEHVPSGVYFYRLQAGAFSAVKKMLMLK